MKVLFIAGSLMAAAAAVPDPLITPRAALAPRQDEPALLGWVDATNEQFSDSRTCDYPATLSSSGSLAQCCAADSSCVFWSSCNAGTLFASATSLFCDQGYCNTAVLVPTVGAQDGQNYLGCWATSLGQSPFTLVRDIGTGGQVAPSTAVSSATTTASRVTSAASSATASTAQSSTGAPQSSAAAAVSKVQPLAPVLGLVGILFGVL